MSRDAFVSVLAVLVGMAIAWLSWLLNWVDTGTSLGLALLAAGVFAARGLSPLSAGLSVSTPAVLLAFLVQKPETAIALPAALIGAYLGGIFRRLMRWGAPPPPTE